MNTSTRAASAGPLTVQRVRTDVWILRLLESLEQDAVAAVRDAFVSPAVDDALAGAPA